MTAKVTLASIAKQLNVSPATVSRALHNSPRVNATTRLKIHQLAASLNFHPNTVAQAMRQQQTMTIGVVVSNILNPYFTQLLRGISDECQRHGFSVLFVNSDEQNQKEISDLQLLNSQMVAGLIVASTGGITNYSQLLHDTPTVFVDRLPNENAAKYFDAILSDNYQGAYELTERLLKTGAHDIAFIGSNVDFSANERRLGYTQALTDNHIPIKQTLIRQTDYTPATTEHIIHELQQRTTIDAALVSDTVILQQLFATLPEAQSHMLTFATFDYLPWFDYLKFHVLSAQQATYQIGHQAVTTLLNRLANPTSKPETTRLPIAIHQNF